jgi:hypothetical protein
VNKVMCQFLIGNVYQRKPIPIGMNCKCQFLIGNVYRDYNMHMQEKDILLECQFLIGNVYQLVLSVSNYDTTPFSSQNQSKMFKKSVDLQQLRLCKPMILQHSLLFLNYSLTSTGFLSKNYAN